MPGRNVTPRPAVARWLLPIGLVVFGAGLLVLTVADKTSSGEAWWPPLAGALGTGLVAGGSVYVLRQRRAGAGGLPRRVHIALGLGMVLLIAVLVYLYAF